MRYIGITGTPDQCNFINYLEWSRMVKYQLKCRFYFDETNNNKGE